MKFFSGLVVSALAAELKPHQHVLNTPEVPHHILRICNAYPLDRPLEAFQNSANLGDINYKACADFDVHLQAGDHIRFKEGRENAGIFEIANLPPAESTLLLVINRHDTLTNAVKFESHVFKDMAHAQIAVIDTYKGVSKSGLRIEDQDDDVDASRSSVRRSENLKFGSVHKVNTGKYEVELFSEDKKKEEEKKDGKGEKDGKKENKTNLTLDKKGKTDTFPLVALPHETYVVMRVGVASLDGNVYPEEVVVFPTFDESLLQNTAFGMSVVGLLVFFFGF